MRRYVALLACAAGLLAFAPGASAAPTEIQGPLFGLDTGHKGALLVADASQGIVRTGRGKTMLVAALPGVNDIAVRSRQTLWAISTGDKGAAFLWRVNTRSGAKAKVADLGAYERKNNPAGDDINPNPFEVINLGRGRAAVADAGANTLYHINRRGKISVIATFPEELVSTENVKEIFGCPDGPPDICNLPPEIPAQAVTTSVTRRPDGAFYVGELKGFPAPHGESRVWRVEPGTRNAHCGSDARCSVELDGFTSIIDLRWFRDHLYVAEMDEAGFMAGEIDPALAEGGTVNQCHHVGERAERCTQLVTRVPILTAMTFRRNGELWATVDSLLPSARVEQLAVVEDH